MALHPSGCRPPGSTRGALRVFPHGLRSQPSPGTAPKSTHCARRRKNTILYLMRS